MRIRLKTHLIGLLFVAFTCAPLTRAPESPLGGFDDYVNKAIRDWGVPGFGRPITLKNLTHTPGFEEQLKDFFAADNANPNLGDFVKTHIPRRIYPPGPGKVCYEERNDLSRAAVANAV